MRIERDDFVWGAVALLVVSVASLAVLQLQASIWLMAGAVLALGFLAVLPFSPGARLLAVVCGALLVFQTENMGAKFAYLGLLMLCLAVSLVHTVREDPDDISAAFKPLPVGAAAMSAALAWSLLISRDNGIPIGLWAQDTLTYVLPLVTPFIGYEVGRRLSARFLQHVTVVVGIIAAIGFATDWLSRRGAAVNLDRFVLASSVFCIFAFAYLLTRAGTVRHWFWWFLGASVVAGALVLTGTRTNVALLAAVFIGVLGSRDKLRVPFGRLVGLAVLMGLAGMYVIPWVAGRVLSNSQFLGARIEALLSTLTVSGLQSDQSFQVREAGYAAARARWEEHIWFGGGPGHIYPSSGNFGLDTPWLLLAKFGLLGSAAILFYLFSIWRSISRTAQTSNAARTASRGWVAAMVVLIPFGNWLEDKGAGLVLLLIVAFVVAHAREVDAHDKTPETAVSTGENATPKVQV